MADTPIIPGADKKDLRRYTASPVLDALAREAERNNRSLRGYVADVLFQEAARIIVSEHPALAKVIAEIERGSNTEQ